MEAGVEAGASICFFRATTGVGGDGEAVVRRVYRGLTEELVEGMHMMLRGEGALGRTHLVKVNGNSEKMSIFSIHVFFACKSI